MTTQEKDQKDHQHQALMKHPAFILAAVACAGTAFLGMMLQHSIDRNTMPYAHVGFLLVVATNAPEPVVKADYDPASPSDRRRMPLSISKDDADQLQALDRLAVVMQVSYEAANGVISQRMAELTNSWRLSK